MFTGRRVVDDSVFLLGFDRPYRKTGLLRHAIPLPSGGGEEEP